MSIIHVRNTCIMVTSARLGKASGLNRLEAIGVVLLHNVNIFFSSSPSSSFFTPRSPCL